MTVITIGVNVSQLLFQAFGLMYLEPGSYIFIPTAYKAEDRGEFFLRIFAQGRMGVT